MPTSLPTNGWQATPQTLGPLAVLAQARAHPTTGWQAGWPTRRRTPKATPGLLPALVGTHL